MILKPERWRKIRRPTCKYAKQAIEKKKMINNKIKRRSSFNSTSLSIFRNHFTSWDPVVVCRGFVSICSMRVLSWYFSSIYFYLAVGVQSKAKNSKLRGAAKCHSVYIFLKTNDFSNFLHLIKTKSANKPNLQFAWVNPSKRPMNATPQTNYLFNHY